MPSSESRPAPEATTPPVSLACDGHGRTGWMLRQTLLGLTNNLGAVYEVKTGWCRPLVKKSSLLFKMSQLEPGAFAFITPSFVRGGGYLELVPLSFLVLRFSASGIYYFPLPGFKAAAYFDAGSRDFSWPSSGFVNHVTVDKEQGGGVNLSATLVLRAAVTLKRLPKGPLELFVLNSFAADYWYFGTHDYYYNQRADAVLSRSDVALQNTAAVLVGFPLTTRVGMRVGATDSLLYLPRPKEIGWNQVGGLIMFPLQIHHRRISDFTVFTRITYFTNHFTRRLTFAWNFLVGIDMSLRI